MQQAAFELAVRTLGGSLEDDPLAVDLEEHLRLLLMQRYGKFVFERGHLGEQSADMVVQGLPLCLTQLLRIVCMHAPDKTALHRRRGS